MKTQLLATLSVLALGALLLVSSNAQTDLPVRGKLSISSTNVVANPSKEDKDGVLLLVRLQQSSGDTIGLVKLKVEALSTNTAEPILLLHIKKGRPSGDMTCNAGKTDCSISFWPSVDESCVEVHLKAPGIVLLSSPSLEATNIVLSVP